MADEVLTCLTGDGYALSWGGQQVDDRYYARLAL